MLQTVLIPKAEFSLINAVKWLQEHSLIHPKVDITEKYYRFRQNDPIPGVPYYTVKLPNGIDQVFQKDKPRAKPLGAAKRSVVQSFVAKLREFLKPWKMDKKSMNGIIDKYKKTLQTVHNRLPEMGIKEFTGIAEKQYNEEIEMEDNESTTDEE